MLPREDTLEDGGAMAAQQEQEEMMMMTPQVVVGGEASLSFMHLFIINRDAFKKILSVGMHLKQQSIKRGAFFKEIFWGGM